MASGFVRVAMEEFRSHENNTWPGVVKHYWNIIDDHIKDPRADNFLLMSNPLMTIGLVLTYLTWVLIVGPFIMRDRKPMNLKRTLIVYNAFQVSLSAYMFYEHLMAGWWFNYSFTCQKVDYSDSPQAQRMLNLCYIYYISKLTEFCDTIFFVLRKKKSQITILHVYHHSLTPLEAWALVKYIAGGNSTFPNIINNFIHVIMYSYYLLAALGPQYQKYLWWKKYMTELQIIQFVICIVHECYALHSGCDYPTAVTSLLLLNSTIFFALFMNFYLQTFKTKSIVKDNKEIKDINENINTKVIHENNNSKTIKVNNNKQD